MAKRKTPRFDRIIKKRSRNGKFYFTRKAPNGEPIGRSQIYQTRGGCDKAVRRLREQERVIVEPGYSQ